ncbi:amidohydrolase [Thalassotalea castellviae]|uniref:Amidohydrolase n=1 Tax=Thalassotalea castellviae TaxID=3075612 RepID=A0ABU3A141_9GAMM|nr:amidohydrolase [Thalassotalea sp. W431]MDT0603894.1 amidohydrolase [Thalassotalea sp. W431]
MKKFSKLCSLMLFVFITSCAEKNVQSPELKADLVLTNGKIYTVDETKPWAQAVAIKDDEIVYVGDNKGVQAWITSETKQQDLAGQMLLPGFIDSHVHPVMGGAYVRSLSLDTFGTPEHWYKQIKEYAAQHPEDEVLFGYGFLASAFGPEGPTSAMLDNIIADRAVYLMDEGFHGAWGNTKALELLKIDKNTPDPEPGFSYYKRDEQGNPTGYFLEGTATAAIDQLGIISVESVALGTSDVIKILNSYGVTSVFDAGALDVGEMQVDILDKIVEQGDMTIRMKASHMVSSAEDYDTAIEQTLHKRAISKREMYHINMLKIMNDGTIEGKTASMFEDYQNEPNNKGENVFNQQQMNSLISRASAENIDVHIHALGERAISETLNAIELVRKDPKSANSTSRYTICHIQVLTDSDIPRFAELDVIAQSTPLWASYDDFGKSFVSDDQFNRYFRFNSIKETGAKMSFGSDFPASGAGTLGMSPIFNMEVGHTRQSAENAPIQPGEHERLDIATLIKGYTIDGAYQLHMEDSIGSITVGKKADLVLLDKNLFEVEKYNIHNVKVLQTILGGKTVYRAEGEVAAVSSKHSAN